MTQHLDDLRLSGARILRDGRLETGAITLTQGHLSDDPAPTVDLGGYLVLPGIIDLHGDAFERHVAPRITAPFPIAMALESTDRDAASCGVTTAWMAQSWSWEGGMRGPDFAIAFMAALADYRPRAQTDLRIQIRCETHTMDSRDQLVDAIRRFGVDYVVFNDHLGEALALEHTNPELIAAWAKRAGRTSAQHMEVVHAARARSNEVPRYLCALASTFDELKLRYGSHDDADAETRERFAQIGAKICEFPTSVGAAKAAHAYDDPVLMGAPNVVRGGSQSGNISAARLIAQGYCDALVSDYHYPTLAAAAFRLADDGLMDLAAAWAMISTRPAQIFGLADRGVIAPGKRADLVVIEAETRRVAGTLAGGRWSYLSGDLAHRMARQGLQARLAAE